jgi:hypothetical protein
MVLCSKTLLHPERNQQTICVLKSSIFWDIRVTSYNSLKVNRRSEGTRRLHLQDRRVTEARNQHEAANKHSSSCYLL